MRNFSNVRSRRPRIVGGGVCARRLPKTLWYEPRVRHAKALIFWRIEYILSSRFTLEDFHARLPCLELVVVQKQALVLRRLVRLVSLCWSRRRPLRSCSLLHRHLDITMAACLELRRREAGARDRERQLVVRVAAGKGRECPGGCLDTAIYEDEVGGVDINFELFGESVP